VFQNVQIEDRLAPPRLLRVRQEKSEAVRERALREAARGEEL
jgi:hypothetical protein